MRIVRRAENALGPTLARLIGSERRRFAVQLENPLATFGDRLWKLPDPFCPENTAQFCFSCRSAYAHGLRSRSAGQLRSVRCQVGVARRMDFRQELAN